MRMTSKGQVTIPLRIREKLGLHPHAEVDFIEENGRIYVVKKANPQSQRERFRRYRGAATVRMSTEEILKLTRKP